MYVFVATSVAQPEPAAVTPVSEYLVQIKCVEGRKFIGRIPLIRTFGHLKIFNTTAFMMQGCVAMVRIQME